MARSDFGCAAARDNLAQCSPSHRSYCTGGARWGVTAFPVIGTATCCKTRLPLPSRYAAMQVNVSIRLTLGVRIYTLLAPPSIDHMTVDIPNKSLVPRSRHTLNAVRQVTYGRSLGQNQPHQATPCYFVTCAPYLYGITTYVKYLRHFFRVSAYGVIRGKTCNRQLRPRPARLRRALTPRL